MTGKRYTDESACLLSFQSSKHNDNRDKDDTDDG